MTEIQSRSRSQTPTTIADTHKSISNSQKTLPNSPSFYDSALRTSSIPSAIIDDHNGDFARLTPANRLACDAFHRVVTKLRALPEESQRPLKYMHFVLQEAPPLTDWSDSDSEVQPRSHELSMFTGYYRFNLDTCPADWGWTFGALLGIRPGDVDLVLSDGRNDNIHSRHGRFTHNLSNSAFLILVPRKRKIVLGGERELQGTSEVLWAQTTGITIGNLTYRLTYTDLDKDEYLQQLGARRIGCGLSLQTPETLQPTPEPHHYVLENYVIKGTFARGSTSTVVAGLKRRGGDAVAIKKIQRTKYNLPVIKNEIEVSEKLGVHPRICSLLQVIYSGGDKDTIGPHGVDEVHLIYEPFGICLFADLISSNSSQKDRVLVFKQCLEGVAFLHRKGLMHRDLKPGNIAMASINPPEAFIIDFGVATWDQSAINHMVGTIAYLAPEVLCLKEKISTSPYGKTVDIWALGLCGAELFSRQKAWWNYKFEKATFCLLMEAQRRKMPVAEGTSLGQIHKLLDCMLQYQAADRTSAEAALLHESLQDLEANDLNDDSLQHHRKRRRVVEIT
ncbi:MAG: hypothetical protein M4579_002955 [Chaenotheca gracillima]|nr:MAG: hypothetical protein M4579_002955 [Chaenotheca gracillima]